MSGLIRNYFSIRRVKKQLQNRKISFFMFYDEQTTISNKTRIQRFVVLRKCSLGDYSYIGYNTNIYHADIGKFCSISKDVSIGLPSHPVHYLSTSPLFVNPSNGTGYSWADKNYFDPAPAKVRIGNDVWIGMKSTIMGGIHIGNGAVVAAHSVVTKDVPPYAIVGGVPAKVIRYRFPEDVIERLEKLAWWNRSDDYLKERISAFQQEVSVQNSDRLMEILG